MNISTDMENIPMSTGLIHENITPAAYILNIICLKRCDFFVQRELRSCHEGCQLFLDTKVNIFITAVHINDILVVQQFFNDKSC